MCRLIRRGQGVHGRNVCYVCPTCPLSPSLLDKEEGVGSMVVSTDVLFKCSLSSIALQLEYSMKRHCTTTINRYSERDWRKLKRLP